MTYLEGSPLLEKDLHRARADTASAFFIMSDKHSNIPDEEDSKIILQHLSIRRFLENSSKEMKQLFCLQLIRPENRRHLLLKGPVEAEAMHNMPTKLLRDHLLMHKISETKRTYTEKVICLNEIKMATLSKAILCRGSNTLVMNLFSSFSYDDGVDDDDEVDPRTTDVHLFDDRARRGSVMRRGSVSGGGVARRNSIVGGNAATAADPPKPQPKPQPKAPKPPLQSKPSQMSRVSFRGNAPRTSISIAAPTQDDEAKIEPWIEEYIKGFGCELYTTKLSPIFVGIKFIELSYMLYQRMGVTLIALKVTERKNKYHRILLNPGQYVIPDFQDFEVLGFVIAKNKKEADLSFMDDDQGNKRSHLTFFISLRHSLKSAVAEPVRSSSSRRLGLVKVSNMFNNPTKEDAQAAEAPPPPEDLPPLEVLPTNKKAMKVVHLYCSHFCCVIGATSLALY